MNYDLTKLKPFGVLITPKEKKQSIDCLNIEAIREHVIGHQLVLLRGFDTFETKDDFSRYCEGWGELSQWPFGTVLELIEQEKPGDHIFDNSYMPLHWDGMYREEVPEYQIFHCVKAPSKEQGGRTTFSNTLSVLEHATSELKALWRKVSGVYQRQMAFYNSKTISPVITKHPYRECEVIRYNEPHSDKKGTFINKPMIDFQGVDEKTLSYFKHGLEEMLYSQEHFYAHAWQDNDIVIADNFSLLHGREAFTSKSPRHLQRVHVLSSSSYKNPHLVSSQ